MNSTKTTVEILVEIKDVLLQAFMNAPQIDGRNAARVPVDLVAPSKSARDRILENKQQNRSGLYWASNPHLPVTSA